MPDSVRTLQDLIGRLDGPLHFRFILQPLMASLLAIRDGRQDARAGRKPFRVLTDPTQRRQVLLSSWKSVGKVFAIALILDFAYQLMVFHRFYPSQALLVALFLAMIPYFALRGPVNWLARSWVRRSNARMEKAPK
jgi:hypothetical protein